MLAAWLATRLFVDENLQETNINAGPGNTNDMSPWLLNKRMNQF
jgi:hypothetical protein